jgi:hypothetical protein
MIVCGLRFDLFILDDVATNVQECARRSRWCTYRERGVEADWRMREYTHMYMRAQ